MGLRLLPSHVAMFSDAHRPDEEPHPPPDSPTGSTEAADSEWIPTSPTSYPETENETSPGEEYSESYIPLDEQISKTMTRGQKRQLEQDLHEVRAHDECLWGTLKEGKRAKPLPRGRTTYFYGDLRWSSSSDHHCKLHGLCREHSSGSRP